MDLDIQNYSLEEIMNLFKIPLNFDVGDLKRAKKLVLMSHPDKSNLPSEYFLFYSNNSLSISLIISVLSSSLKSSIWNWLSKYSFCDVYDVDVAENEFVDRNDVANISFSLLLHFDK